MREVKITTKDLENLMKILGNVIDEKIKNELLSMKKRLIIIMLCLIVFFISIFIICMVHCNYKFDKSFKNINYYSYGLKKDF